VGARVFVFEVEVSRQRKGQAYQADRYSFGCSLSFVERNSSKRKIDWKLDKETKIRNQKIGRKLGEVVARVCVDRYSWMCFC